MKKILLGYIFLTLLSFSLMAQPTKNNLSLGGGFRIVHAGDEHDFETITEFHLRPVIGYFLADRFELGAAFDLGIGNGIVDDDDYYVIRNKSISIGPFAKYYIKTPITNFSFTLKAEVSVLFLTREIKPEDSGNFKTWSESFGISLTPGFTYFFTEKWGLDFQLQGISFSQTPYLGLTRTILDETDEFVFNVSLNPTLGFRYFIAR